MTMQFTKSELAKILAALSPYITAGSILSLRIQSGTLIIFTTEHIEGGSVLARVPITKDEKATQWLHIPGAVLQHVIQNALDGVITMEVGKASLVIKSPGSSSEIRFSTTLIEPKDVKFGETFTSIKGKSLNLISAMTEAASEDECRANLKGIYVAVENKELRAAAADGFILSFTSFKMKSADVPGAVYSVKALNRARRSIKADDDEDISLGFNKSSIALSVTRENVVYLFDIPRTSGGFPDYMKLVAGVSKAVSVEVETAPFSAFLKRAKAVEGNVYLQASAGRLQVLATNVDTGQSSFDAIPLQKAIDGESVCMFYAERLLGETIKACAPNGKVVMTFPKANNMPMLFEGAAAVLAMPLAYTLKENPFKKLQPALI